MTCERLPLFLLKQMDATLGFRESILGMKPEMRENIRDRSLLLHIHHARDGEGFGRVNLCTSSRPGNARSKAMMVDASPPQLLPFGLLGAFLNIRKTVMHGTANSST